MPSVRVLFSIVPLNSPFHSDSASACPKWNRRRYDRRLPAQHTALMETAPCGGAKLSAFLFGGARPGLFDRADAEAAVPRPTTRFAKKFDAAGYAS